MAGEAEALVQIRADDARPIYVQIVDEVRRAIVAGALDPDEALPSVRELASALQVNPNTVSRAYRELEREGVVHVRRGRGTFVAPEIDRDEDRARLAREVARRALRDARRHSLSAGELVEAIRGVAGAGGEEEPVGGEAARAPDGDDRARTGDDDAAGESR